MITVILEHGLVKQVRGWEKTLSKNPVKALLQLAQHTEAWCCWYDERLSNRLNAWKNPMNEHEVVHIGHIHEGKHIADLGYVFHDSAFMVVPPKDKKFPSWHISSAGGMIHTSVIRASGLDERLDFSSALADLLVRSTRRGVMPFSDPSLLKSQEDMPIAKVDAYGIVANNVEKANVLFLGCCHLLFKKRLHLGKIVEWLLRKSYHKSAHLKKAKKAGVLKGNVSVVIPTLNRPKEVRDVLRDLAQQTREVKEVIIIDQGEEKVKIEEKFPFNVLIEQVSWKGACKARNAGLKKAKQEYVLLLDDDIRFSSTLIETLFKAMDECDVDAVCGLGYLKHQEKVKGSKQPFLLDRFDTLCCLMRTEVATSSSFDEKLEGGFSEDYDFGMQLRFSGYAIGAVPHQVLHLKSPAGGFRTVRKLIWDKDTIYPYPSPFIVYTLKKWGTAYMVKGFLFYLYAKGVLKEGPYKLFKRIKRTNFWSDQLLYEQVERLVVEEKYLKGRTQEQE